MLYVIEPATLSTCVTVGRAKKSMADTSIDLAKQKPKLTALPDGLDVAATSLDVSENALTALPPAIGTLTSLKTLNVSDNQLGELPEEIGSLRAVEALLLYKNVLKRLPDAVGRLHNLKILNAFNNRMMTFPAALGAPNPILFNTPHRSHTKAVCPVSHLQVLSPTWRRSTRRPISSVSSQRPR